MSATPKLHEHSDSHGNRRGKLPAGPRMPSELQALGWALRPLPFMMSCRRRYGDIFTLRVRRNRPWVFLSAPDDVGKVLTIAPELVRAGAGEANPLLGPLLGPRSVMLLDEPDHMTHRRFMLPSFHGQMMRSYGEMMVDVARAEIARWPVGQPLALWPRMQAISNEVVMRATFGSTDSPQMERLRTLLQRLTDFLNDSSRLTVLATFGSRFLERSERFRAVIAPVEAALLEEVRARRAARAGAAVGNGAAGVGNGAAGGAAHDDDFEDANHAACIGAADGAAHDGNFADANQAAHNGGILAMLEQAYDEHGTPMSEQEVRDELITLLSDGPTATSLSWAFERLLRHPDKLRRLRAEVEAGEEETYVDAVVKETLRLAPAVPLVMRGLVEPMRLGGHHIPAGTIVAPCIYLVHHRDDIYPRPFSFTPERFLGKAPDNYTWIPFGSGVRRCVAAQFAQLEMKRVMQTVIEEVELAPAPSAGSQRATRSSVAFAPGDQAPVVVTRRRTPRAKAATLAAV
ncbi:MAG TPA: cytochrome P450 [Solirubrobacteraceae bacterium]|jgi:cytochrome P450|nr:cytochrome P450 [Solirubrobacteraceae bacterium]